MSKTRKPRATKKRVEAAELYLNIAGTCTVFAEVTESPEMMKLIRDNRKNLTMGKEYLQDLLLWEKDRIIFKQKKSD